MVRLVFRPYTQFRRSICTSESLRTSTRVSPGFVLTRHSSPSFGSQHVRSRYAQPSEVKTSRRCAYRYSKNFTESQILPWSLLNSCKMNLHFHYAFEFEFSITRVHVRLLGPCFKTGQADHTCFRWQYWTEPNCPSWQLVYKSHYSYLSIQLAYTTRQDTWPRFNACSLIQQPQKYLETRT